MKLRGRMRVENGVMTAVCQLFDGNTFKIHPPEHHYGINDEFLKSRDIVDGWVLVMQEGKQGNACYITLPSASELHGKNVTVSEYDLIPVNATLKDYGAK